MLIKHDASYVSIILSYIHTLHDPSYIFRSPSPSPLLLFSELNDLLQSVDYELWKHLDMLGVDPRFYSFRWITLMLSQGMG